MTQPYIIFFRGLNGLIDETAAKQLASNRGCEAVFYPYSEWFEAAAKVVGNDTSYHVVGFSRGAAPDIMGGFMKRIRSLKARLPEDLMTVGLYGPKGGGFTQRYMDNQYDCINFLDSSGQRHAGEHNSVNLGANVPHLGEGGGMQLAAKMFEGPGKYQLPPKPGTAPKADVAPPVLPTAVGGVVLSKQDWPTQAHAMAFYGNPASKGWAASHLVSVPCPWTLLMEKTVLHSIQIHKLCAPSLGRVLEYTWERCGKDQEKINALHFNLYSGSYNYRPMRGGTSLSMHSYGAAIDWDDQENQQHAQKHLFTKDTILIKAFLDEGWIWGGNWSPKSIDSMHVQAAVV